MKQKKSHLGHEKDMVIQTVIEKLLVVEHIKEVQFLADLTL